MSEQLILIHDREVLKRTLLEISEILSPSATRSSLRARVRVLWLCRTLCASCLSPSEVSTLQDVTSRIQDLLRREPHGIVSVSGLASISQGS